MGHEIVTFQILRHEWKLVFLRPVSSPIPFLINVRSVQLLK
jgi:hypothetical protein